MNPEQISKLLVLLEKIASGLADRHYTITGASDWPILAVMGGTMVGMVAFMWLDLRSSIKDKNNDLVREIEKEKDEREKQDNYIWAEIRNCQDDCHGKPHARREPRA